MELYKEYKLLSNTQQDALRRFIEINANCMAKNGTPIHVILTTANKKRNSQQNKRYWGYLLKYISAYAWVGGRQYSSDVWHEFFAKKYGVCEDIEMPDGDVIVKRKSTTSMSVSEFTAYMREVEMYSVTELGINWREIDDC